MFDHASTKKCSRCGAMRPLVEFAWRKKAAGKRGPYCRGCRRAYAKTHYAANRDLYIERARRRNQIVRQQRAAHLIEFLSSNPCVDCGENDPTVLEFDHVAGKDFTIGERLRDTRWELVLAEIAKCDVVCANCHRRRTAKRGGFLRAALIKQGSG
jgi:hypothetical protein